MKNHCKDHFVSCLKLLLYCYVSSCGVIHYLDSLIQSSVPQNDHLLCIDLTELSVYSFKIF